MTAVEMFLNLPERWLAASPVKWRCEEGHISTMFLKTEISGDRCLACRTPVLLTFPEDEEGGLLGAEIYAMRRAEAERPR